MARKYARTKTQILIDLLTIGWVPEQHATYGNFLQILWYSVWLSGRYIVIQSFRIVLILLAPISVPLIQRVFHSVPDIRKGEDYDHTRP